jgi:hypothetical protein
MRNHNAEHVEVDGHPKTSGEVGQELANVRTTGDEVDRAGERLDACLVARSGSAADGGT